jgi:hypothetical protein
VFSKTYAEHGRAVEQMLARQRAGAGRASSR